MKLAIQQRARALGFDACGFTTAEPPTSAARFEKWLAEQRHGAMSYLARNADKRIDPQKVLADAKTVIALAVSYGGGPVVAGASPVHEGAVTDGEGSTAKPRQETGRPLGVIARYARYRDYHDVLAEKLKELTAFVAEIGGDGIRSLWYVDTGPLLERDLAQRAGVGFIGKHTNLIGRRLGNWILLAEIITTLELPPDPPETNRCGTCHRCIDACPTRAITAPFELDARRCISYLTIELKGSIPVELRPAIGNRIFGCDDCLAACPWNRFAREGQLMKEHRREDLTQPRLLNLLTLDEDGFRRSFGGTPITRAKRRGLLRNVCVALGNLGDSSALSALEVASRNPEPLIAEHARWALDQIERRPGNAGKPQPSLCQESAVILPETTASSLDDL